MLETCKETHRKKTYTEGLNPLQYIKIFRAHLVIIIKAYSRRDSFSITYTYLPTLLLTHHTILLEALQRIWGASKNSGSKKEID